MSREIEVAADRLRRAINYAKPCDPWGEHNHCDVDRLADAAQELLDELQREKLIPAWL